MAQYFHNLFTNNGDTLPSNGQLQTSHTIPQDCPTRCLNKTCEQFLSKSNTITTITSITHTQTALRYVRTMLLQDSYVQAAKQSAKEGEEEGKGQGGQGGQGGEGMHGVRAYCKMGMMYNERAESVSWVLFQVGGKSQSCDLAMIACVSCTILYQLSDIEHDRKQLQQLSQQHRKSIGKVPQIYCLSSHSHTQSSQLSYPIINISQQLPTQNLQVLQNLYQKGRKIINQGHQLQNNKSMHISCGILPCFFRQWLLVNGEVSRSCRQLQQGQGKVLQQPVLIWNSAIQMLISQTSHKCLQEYRSRMHKLLADKKPITLKQLRTTHQLSHQLSLKQLQKHKLPINCHQQLQTSINKQLNAIVQQVNQINLEWGRMFVQAQFMQIEGRLKNKEFKLLGAVKQEFGVFVEYFMRKVDGLNCKKLQVFFVQYILNKAFDYSSYIYQTQLKHYQSQLQSHKTKQSQLQTQQKQQKRQHQKQQSQHIKHLTTLQQQLSLLKNKQQLLSSTIMQLKSDKQYIENQSMCKVQECEKMMEMEMGELRKENGRLREQVEELGRCVREGRCQVEKERQMHRQSCEHYGVVVEELRAREQELKEEIEDITMRASQELESLKKDSERQLNKSTITRAQRQKQGKKLVEQLTQLQHKHNELQTQHNNLQYQHTLLTTQQTTQNQDLQLSLQLLQQKLLHHQSQQPLITKLQSDLQQYQSLHQQHQHQQKQYQKQIALLRQQNIFINEKIAEVEGKYESQRMCNVELKACVEELEGKMVGGVVGVNQWVQTEDDGGTRMKGMLEDMYGIVGVLEKEYKKVMMENTKLRLQLGQI